jgi:predicted nuclease of predicted toxin-antitoxin system
VRFFLDNDVDARCLGVLQSHGHTAWHTYQAGRSLASDQSQSSYALSKDAVLVTHDREFTRSRWLGKTVWLRVEQPFGPDVLERHLNDFVPALEHNDDLLVEVRQTQISLHYANGGEQPLTRSKLE